MIHSSKVAVIGAGYWGKNLVRNFHDLGALGMIVDPNPVIQQKMAQDYPGFTISQSYADALSDPEIGGVAIVTPAETHGSLIREAILAGKDVYVEKPLCLSPNEGGELIQLADERKVVLMVGHLLWYHPTLLKLNELIQQGKLGRISYIYSNRLNIGKLRREENVLWSFAPHDVSVILGLLGEMPDSVHAQGGNYLHQNIADVTVTLLSFGCGVKAHIFVSWLHPFKEQKLVVVGDRQMAVFDDTAPWEKKLQLYPHSIDWNGNIPVANKADAVAVEVAQDEPLRAECAHFLQCIESRQSPRTDGEEGLRVLKVLNACQKSLETLESVKLHDFVQPDYFVHATAVVDSGAEIGRGSKIWHFSHVLTGSVIGNDCRIGQNVVIGPKTVVGTGCKIQNNVSVYEGVTLEDHVFCGPSLVFTNVYNPRAEIPRMGELRKTLVKKGATLGANATIVCGIIVGRYAFVGAGSVVIRDVADHAMVVGNPAHRVGWICRCGERLDADLRCSACEMVYQEEANGLEQAR